MSLLRTGVASFAAVSMAFGLSACGESGQPSRAEVIDSLTVTVANEEEDLVFAKQQLDDHFASLPEACATVVHEYLDETTVLAVGIIATAGICPSGYSLIDGRRFYKDTQTLYISLAEHREKLDIQKAMEFASQVTTTTAG